MQNEIGLAYSVRSIIEFIYNNYYYLDNGAMLFCIVILSENKFIDNEEKNNDLQIDMIKY